MLRNPMSRASRSSIRACSTAESISRLRNLKLHSSVPRTRRRIFNKRSKPHAAHLRPWSAQRLPVFCKSCPIVEGMAGFRLLRFGIKRDISQGAHAPEGPPVRRGGNHIPPRAGIDIEAVACFIAFTETYL